MHNIKLIFNSISPTILVVVSQFCLQVQYLGGLLGDGLAHQVAFVAQCVDDVRLSNVIPEFSEVFSYIGYLDVEHVGTVIEVVERRFPEVRK